MSHTTEIKAVAIIDIDALRAAVAELVASGIRCELLPNRTPRAYYPNQTGLGLADFVLNLQTCEYDVGFYKNEDGKTYSARTDLWQGKVAAVLGANMEQARAQGPEAVAQASLGKLFQAYAVNAAVRQAAKQGYRVMRSTKADGTVQLTMTV